jgi:PAS domain S-box-containing protein
MFGRLKIGAKILLLTVSLTITVIIISLIVSNYSTHLALEKAAFDKLTAVREMKSQQIEDYFLSIQNQMLTFSEDQMIIDAMRSFNDSFRSIRGELVPRIDDYAGAESALQRYYEEEFIPRLAENLVEAPDRRQYLPTGETTRLLQYLYIAGNPEPTGEKHRLDAAKDYTSYSAAHGKFHPIIRSYLEKFGYYDIFLVDIETGHIVYSVFKEVDYATSLLTGPHKDSNLASAFREARGAEDRNFIHIVDFAHYAPSYNDEASFIASPIFDGDRKIGVLVFQMPVDRINDIMTNRQSWADVGLGQSGETYIVADDYTLRNQSRFLIEDREQYLSMLAEAGTSPEIVAQISSLDTSIGLQRADTSGTRAALSGETSTMIFPDYRDVEVLSAFAPLDIAGMNWVIMSEIDAAEAYAHILELRNRMIALGAVLILLVAALSYGLSRSLSRPVRFLGQSARALTAGDLETPVKRESGDEIGDLAENFEQMRLALQRSFGEIQRKNDELEQRVEERTADLNLALEKVQESEQRISAVVEGITDAVVTIDQGGIIQTFNAAAEKIFAYTVDSAIGKNIKILMPEAIAAEHDAILERYEPSRVSSVVDNTREVEGRRKDGELFPLELRVSRITTGTENMFVGLMRDITERKAMEARKKEVAEELKRARQAADDANQAKSDFLANMSHEIRTPMNAVIGLSDLCLNTDLSAKQEDYLNKIHASAVALLGIINDILDFSKIEAGKLDIEAVPFEIDEVLENLATVVLVKTQEKGLELMFDRSPEVPSWLVGDPLRLGQILVNLCNNAAKFTESGEILVSIGMNTLDGEQITLECKVRDTGIGMTDEQQSRLFKSFSQADASTTRKYGGTGLGLAISKQLVEMMGGEIWVESEQGVGSTFGFRVALGVAKGDQKREFLPADDVKGMHVLVVDDNATSREILQSYLDSFTFDVSLASNGEEALSLLRDNSMPVDLVMLDWMMPGMSGLDLATGIRGLDKLEEQPKLILVSAFHGSELMEKPGAEHIDLFLAKPVSPSHLFDAVMEVFGHEAASVRTRRSRGKFDLDTLAPVQGAKILLVEDNEINQQVARELLEQARFHVDVANHGQEALDRLETNRYDCVLMDIQMPVMDGYTATQKIRANDRYVDLPVLAMTANATVEDQEQSLASGMNAHLNKPIDPAALYEALLTWIPHGERSLPEKSADESIADDVELPEIAGVDTQTGLRGIGGSAQAYRKLLHKFVENQVGAIGEIRNARASRDNDTAIRVAHTLKGVGGSIGAGELQRLGAEVEHILKESPAADIDELLVETSTELDRIIRGIQSALHLDGSEENALPEGLPADYQERLGALAGQIEAYDGEAGDTLDTLVAQVGDTEEHARLASLAKLLGQYDYDAALTAIKEMME